jgi:hypothetical protein
MCLSHLINTVRPCLFHTCHAMHQPCRFSQGHGTARPSRDGLWATCPLSASSSYHAEFYDGCYQKHTNLRCRWPVWNQATFVMDEEKSGSNTLRKDDLLTCWTSSSDISGYHVDFHEGHGTIGAWQGRSIACVNLRRSMTGERHRRGRGTACYVWIGLYGTPICLCICVCIYIFIFTCGVSNDACSDSNFTELNGRMSNEDTMKRSVVTWYEILFWYLMSRSEENHDRCVRNADLWFKRSELGSWACYSRDHDIQSNNWLKFATYYLVFLVLYII